MKLTKHGLREWLGGAVIALLLSLAWGWLAINVSRTAGCVLLGITWLLWLAVAAFFRVPDRKIIADPAALVSPADGVVRDIEEVEDHGIEIFAGQKLTRIGIFLSVLDVHVNRAPCDMEVKYRKYKEGRFLDARDNRCAKENESLLIAGTGSAGGRKFPVAIRQISGAIARRIVCIPQPGAVLKKGEIYGMIKFGSRTELYFPGESGITVCVRIGDKVRSGSTLMGRIEN
ncbi:MAG: phosphatidylserine decarboxylase family protein [Kiritimatiellaceae bacterium]|nr:phosphatidylserine decarboxylase family protein [Kiritimatiellaceae bacterium]